MRCHAVLAATLGSGLLVAGIAHAQQRQDQQRQDQQRQDQQPQRQQYQQQMQDRSGSQQLTARDAQQFMQRVERDINQMMQSGNVARLRNWTQANVADNAIFSGTRKFDLSGASNAYASITLTKQDLLRLEQFALSSMPEVMSQIEDYNLNIRVMDVQPIGDSAAMVKSRISETKTLRSPGSMAQGDERQQQQQQFTTGRRQGEMSEGADQQRSRGGQGRFTENRRGGAELDSQATCTHVIERTDGGRIQFTMGICDADTQIKT